MSKNEDQKSNALEAPLSAYEYAQMRFETASLLRIGGQIDLCHVLSQATRLEVKAYEAEPALINDAAVRGQVTRRLVNDFWNATDHPSFKAFSQEMSDEGFEIPRGAFMKYRDGEGCLSRRRILPFMKTIANVGDKAATRLTMKLKEGDAYRISPSINSWKP